MKGILRSIRDWYLIHTRGIVIFLITLIVLSGMLGALIWRLRQTKSPVPLNIKSQVHFTIIYPKNYEIDKTSWKYLSSELTLSFAVANNGNPIVFTEQAIPLVYKDDAASYDRFIGSLKPGVNFKVPLGNVSLVGFVTAGDYSPEGRSGVLKAKGTLLIAHPGQQISDTEWYNLFNSLLSE